MIIKEIFESEEADNFIAEIILPFFDVKDITSSLKNSIKRKMFEKGFIKKSITEIYAEFCKCKYSHKTSISGANDTWADKACEYIKALEKEIEKLKGEKNDNN